METMFKLCNRAFQHRAGSELVVGASSSGGACSGASGVVKI